MTVKRQWQPRPSDTFVPNMGSTACADTISRTSGSSGGQAMPSQPSEIQIIFDDALTDLKAFVDHLLPVASDEAGCFADQMMATIEQAGTTPTDSISSPTTTSERGHESHLYCDHQQQTGVAPQCSASKYSGLNCCTPEHSSYIYDDDDNEAMDDSTSSISSAGLKLVASVPVVPVPASSSTSNKGPSLVNQTMETLDITTNDSFDTSSTCLTEPIQNTPARNRQSSKTDTPNDIDKDKLRSNKSVPESPTQKAEREADEVAGHIAHRTYRLEKSSLSQLIDQFDNNARNQADKQRRLAAPPFVVSNRRLAFVAEKKRQAAQQVQTEAVHVHAEEIDSSTSPPLGVSTNTGYDSDSTDNDVLADDFRSMVVSDLD